MLNATSYVVIRQQATKNIGFCKILWEFSIFNKSQKKGFSKGES
jgi:hypothetical protein